MAHFAELDKDNKVVRVLVFDNKDVDNNGGDQSEQAAEHIKSMIPLSATGIKWIQTSYNNNFRKAYAGIGHIYNASKNKFLLQQPYASWSLDGSDDWQAPVTYPNGDQSAYIISWDEDNLRWVGVKISDNSNHRWDADNTEWVSL